MRTEPCLCGGLIVARDSDDLTSVMSDHNASLLHRQWRWLGVASRERPTAMFSVRDLSGRMTSCVRRSPESTAPSRARARYNGPVGSSDESNILSRGARVSATTRDAGVIASIEVVAR